jgi:hypothetical protein
MPLAQGDVTVRDNRQVDQVPHTEAFNDFPQLRTGDTRKWHSNRSPPSLSIGFCRLCQRRPRKFSRSKISASSAKIDDFPMCTSRPVRSQPGKLRMASPELGVPGTLVPGTLASPELPRTPELYGVPGTQELRNSGKLRMASPELKVTYGVPGTRVWRPRNSELGTHGVPGTPELRRKYVGEERTGLKRPASVSRSSGQPAAAN